jgi:hypothetical protein
VRKYAPLRLQRLRLWDLNFKILFRFTRYELAAFKFHSAVSRDGI